MATNLRRLRAQTKRSQEEFANAHDFDRTYISGIERAVRNPTILVVERLAKALGVDVADLLGAIRQEALTVLQPVRRGFKAKSLPLLLPAQRDGVLDQPLQSRPGWLSASDDRVLDIGREEGEGRDAPQVGIIKAACVAEDADATRPRKRNASCPPIHDARASDRRSVLCRGARA